VLLAEVQQPGRYRSASVAETRGRPPPWPDDVSCTRQWSTAYRSDALAPAIYERKPRRGVFDNPSLGVVVAEITRTLESGCAELLPQQLTNPFVPGSRLSVWNGDPRVAKVSRSALDALEGSVPGQRIEGGPCGCGAAQASLAKVTRAAGGPLLWSLETRSLAFPSPPPAYAPAETINLGWSSFRGSRTIIGPRNMLLLPRRNQHSGSGHPASRIPLVQAGRAFLFAAAEALRATTSRPVGVVANSTAESKRLSPCGSTAAL